MPNFNVPGLGINATGGPSTIGAATFSGDISPAADAGSSSGVVAKQWYQLYAHRFFGGDSGMSLVSSLAAGNYGAQINGASGAARDILQVGQVGVTNGFAVQWDGSNMLYTFNGGVVKMPSGAIVGTDPGGAELIRVGGGARFNANVTLAGASLVGSAPNAAPTVSQTAQSVVTNLTTMSMTVGFALGYGFIYDSSSGHSALFVVRGAGAAIIWQDAAGITGTSGNAGTTNIYVTGGVLTVENRTGQTASYSMITFKLA